MPAVLAPLAIIAAVFGAIALTSRGPLATVAVEGTDVVLRPIGAAKLWSMRGVLRAPLGAVHEVGVGPTKDLPIGFRAPGTALPGVLIAGSYGFGAKRAFWLVRSRKRDALVIELHGQPYARWVVDVPDAPEVARTIEAARP